MYLITLKPPIFATDPEAIITKLLQQYQIEGAMTLRRCWYVLLSNQLVREHPNPANQSQKNAPYRRLSGILLEARIDGRVPWELIIDRASGRRIDNALTWNSVDEAVNHILFGVQVGVLTGFQFDASLKQKRYVEVWVEKDAIAGTVFETTSKYFVPLITAKGFSGGTYLHDAALRFNAIGKPVTVLYLSDLDPEGEYFPKLFREQLPERYGCNVPFEVEKISLNLKQVEEMRLPWIRLTVKKAHLTKKYVRDFIAKYCTGSTKIIMPRKVELDAVDNLTLAKLIDGRLGRLLDRKLIAASMRKSGRAAKKWAKKHRFKKFECQCCRHKRHSHECYSDECECCKKKGEEYHD